MLNKGPAVPSLVVGSVLSLVIGGVIGFYARASTEKSGSPSIATGMSMSSGGGGMSGGGMGGMGGGGMGGGGGQQASSSTTLPRLVRNLVTIQKVQNQGLTPQQSQTLLTTLKEIKSADKLPVKECDAKLAEIEKTLTDSQKEALNTLQPQGGRGGGGGFGGGGGMGGMMGGPPGGGAGGGSAGKMGGGPPGSGGKMGGMGGGGGMGGMMGGGGQQDPEKPFASERNKQALDDLIANLEGQNKK